MARIVAALEIFYARHVDMSDDAPEHDHMDRQALDSKKNWKKKNPQKSLCHYRPFSE